MGGGESIEIVDVTPVPAGADLDTVDFRDDRPRGVRLVVLAVAATVVLGLVLVMVTRRHHSLSSAAPSPASPVRTTVGAAATETAFVTGQETCSTVGTSLRQMTLTARVRNHLRHGVTVRSVNLRFQRGVFVQSVRVGTSKSATGCPASHELKSAAGYRAAPGNLWLAVHAVVAQPCGVPIIGDWT